jgi:SpoVK/Ycf46/Vps4 family AAA+-type ATPase
MRVPERFRRAVVTHVVASFCMTEYPLLLAVEGKPGDGKTYQTDHVLRTAGFLPFRMSATELAGRSEGRPVEQMQALQRRAGEAFEADPQRLPVLVFEDFDLGPAGVSGERRYTVNSQLLTGYLMNLADGVPMRENRPGVRFPVILTSNDLTVLHGPLMRPGRMNVFTWVPAESERAEMILSVLESHVRGMGEAEALRLATEFRELPVSAFATALHDCVASDISAALAPGPVDLARARELWNSNAKLDLERYEASLTARHRAASREKRSFAS